MTALARTSSNLPDPAGWGGAYEILNQRLFNFPDSSHQNSAFSLYFPLKAEINTIKSLIIKHDCNAKRRKFMRLGHTFLTKIDKCHSLRHALAFSLWRRHNRKQPSPAAKCGGLPCLLLLLEKYQLRTSPYHFRTGLRISWERAHLDSMLLALKDTNDDRLVPISQR
jgi:hypothetical protein